MSPAEPDQLLQRGIGQFNDREFFVCHETLEQAWIAEVGPRRLFLQSLIHFAVGFYHHQRGNSEGAVRQLGKGIEKLAAFVPASDGIDTGQLDRDIRAALGWIESGAPWHEYPRIRITRPPSASSAEGP